MATTKTTEHFHTGNGSTTDYSFSFPYLKQADVKVTLDHVATTAYTFHNATTLRFTTAPASGVAIRIYRDTDVDAKRFTLAAGSAVKAGELNENYDQLLYADQEMVDESGISNQAVTAAKLRDDAVVEAKILDSAVTTDKIKDRAVNNDKLADNAVALRNMQNNSVDTAELVDGAVETAKLDNNSVSLAKMQTNSVDTPQLVNEAVETAKIAPLAVNESKLANNSVSIDKMQDDSVDTDELVDLAVEAAKIANDAVITRTIDDDAVTEPKLGTGSVTNRQITDNTISGAKITAGTLDLAKVIAGDVRTLAEQNASPSDAGNDDEIATTAALNRRFDVLYQSGQPTGNDWPVGKVWYDHGADQTLSIWSGSNWTPISSGGTFTRQPTVLYVDAENGSDSNNGHRIIDPIKTIKKAVSEAEHGDVIIVAPGVYRETLPIDITKNNVSIIGQSLRSCFIHPTPATELNTMFRVNSGTQIANFTISGLKAGDITTTANARGTHLIDNDSTYGLPRDQAFVAEFLTDAVIYKSPYIQNCTNFADSGIYNHTQAEYNANNSLGGYFDPNNVNQGGFGGDLTSAPSGGGLLVDGSAVATNSPLRSMVVDSFTQIALDGPGILCCNNGYAQLVSFFGTFCHYHAKALNGGQLNLSNCTTDYGRYGLIADGKSSSAIFTASATAAASTGDLFFTIGAPTAASDWHGSATRPQDNMLVTIGSNTYPVKSATANGQGWDVYIENPDPTALATNLGLTAAIASGAAVSFFYRSYISTGGHTFEYVGSGTDYRADPANGGVPVEANQVKNLNNGKVFQSSTDHNGKFKVGDTFVVDQRTGSVNISLDAYRPEVVNDLSPKLGGDLDVSTHDIVSTSNRDINLLPHGTGKVNMTGGLTATGAISLAGLTYPSSDGATDQVLKTDGNGNLSFVGISALQGAGMQDLSDDTTPQLGGNLDLVTYDIVTTNNRDIDLDPNGSGVVVVKGNSTRGSGSIKLNCEQNSHGVQIKSPAHSANATYTLTLPTALPATAGQALTSDTNGNLGFAAVSSDALTTPQTITASKTYDANSNIGLMGPAVAVASSATLTVPSSSVLTIIN